MRTLFEWIAWTLLFASLLGGKLWRFPVTGPVEVSSAGDEAARAESR